MFFFLDSNLRLFFFSFVFLLDLTSNPLKIKRDETCLNSVSLETPDVKILPICLCPCRNTKLSFADYCLTPEVEEALFPPPLSYLIAEEARKENRE